MWSCKCDWTAARYMKIQEQEENQFFILSAVFYCLRVPLPRLLKFENVTFKVTELKNKIALKCHSKTIYRMLMKRCATEKITL